MERNSEQYKAWLAGLKVGSEVAVHSEAGCELITICKLLQTTFFCLWLEIPGERLGNFFIAETGDSGDQESYIMPPTDADRDTLRRQSLTKGLDSLHWGDLPTHLIAQIVALVDVHHADNAPKGVTSCPKQ